MKRHFRDWKKFFPLFGLVLFAGLIWVIHPEKIWSAMAGVRWPGLAPLPFAVGGVLGLQTLKWQAILRRQGHEIPFRRLLPVQLISLFYGTVTPGRAGGLIKILYLNDMSGTGLMVSGSSVLLDRFLDAVALFALALGGTVLMMDRLQNLFLGLAVSLIFVTAVFLVFYDRRNARWVFERVAGPFVPERLRQKIEGGLEAFFVSLPRRKRQLTVPAALTVLVWVLMFTQNYIVARALGMNVAFWPFVFIVAIGAVVGLIPVTVNGLGTREAVLVVLFSFFSVSPEKVVGMSLLSLVLCTLVPALAGWGCSLKMRSP